MAATFDFTSFFTMAFLGAAPFFTAWLFLIRLILQLAHLVHDRIMISLLFIAVNSALLGRAPFLQL